MVSNVTLNSSGDYICAIFNGGMVHLLAAATLKVTGK